MEAKEIMSLEDMAAFMGITRQFAARLIARTNAPHVRVGKGYRVRLDVVLALAGGTTWPQGAMVSGPISTSGCSCGSRQLPLIPPPPVHVVQHVEAVRTKVDPVAPDPAPPPPPSTSRSTPKRNAKPRRRVARFKEVRIALHHVADVLASGGTMIGAARSLPAFPDGWKPSRAVLLNWQRDHPDWAQVPDADDYYQKPKGE